MRSHKDRQPRVTPVLSEGLKYAHLLDEPTRAARPYAEIHKENEAKRKKIRAKRMPRLIKEFKARVANRGKLVELSARGDRLIHNGALGNGRTGTSYATSRKPTSR